MSFVNRMPTSHGRTSTDCAIGIVHDYGHVDLEIVYDTLTKDIAEIKRFIGKMR